MDSKHHGRNKYEHSFGGVEIVVGLFMSGMLSTTPGDVLWFNATGVMAPLPGGNIDQQQIIYKYSRNNRQNNLNGRICSRTGYWACESEITYVDGAPYIKEFAPRKGAMERYQS
jgi:hypothetical protein